MLRALEADTDKFVLWTKETSPKLSGARLETTEQALSKLNELENDFEPEKQSKYAESRLLIDRATMIEKRLQIELEEATLEAAEWKVYAVLCRAPQRTPPLAHIPSLIRTRQLLLPLPMFSSPCVTLEPVS